QTLALRLARVRRGPVAPIGHELVELGLVLGKAQTIKELAEFALFFLKSAQRVRTVLIEGAIAARGCVIPGAAAHPGSHPVHLALHALHLVLPVTIVAAVISASHSSAPNCEG